MDYSAANHELWNAVIQLGLIAGVILLANFLRQKISFIRKSLMPIAVLGGFLLLLVKYAGVVPVDTSLMEMLVYHGIALGFIAMSLRVPPEERAGGRTGLRSGAVIVSTYLVQGVFGLLVTLALSYTVMPGLFQASGLLLAMGYGQGPGQANNIGSSYESLGFTGGRSFALSIAAAGYLVACVAGVMILNILSRRGRIRPRRGGGAEQPGIDFFQSRDEIPISDSLDKLSVQMAMVLLVYLAAFLTAWGLTAGIGVAAPGLANTVNSLIWGFNFIIGAALAILLRVLLEKGKRAGILRRRYQNNYLLNRISGFCFDIMIVAGIGSIDLEDIRGLWLPFALLAVGGGIVTWLYLSVVCAAVYPDYYYEGLVSMYGMLTGTISSGVLLLRELDPDLESPAANNLITGSGFGILLGAPVLFLVGFAPGSELNCCLTVLLAAVYWGRLMALVYKKKPRRAT